MCKYKVKNKKIYTKLADQFRLAANGLGGVGLVGGFTVDNAQTMIFAASFWILIQAFAAIIDQKA